MLGISKQEASFDRNPTLPLRQLSCFHCCSKCHSLLAELSFLLCNIIFELLVLSFIPSNPQYYRSVWASLGTRCSFPQLWWSPYSFEVRWANSCTLDLVSAWVLHCLPDGEPQSLLGFGLVILGLTSHSSLVLPSKKTKTNKQKQQQQTIFIEKMLSHYIHIEMGSWGMGGGETRKWSLQEIIFPVG